MKSPLPLASLLATLFFASAAAAAAADRVSAQPSVPTTRPMPVKIVHPTDLPSRFKDATVVLTFTLDESGNVHHVAPVGHMPADLRKHLLPVVAQWQFTPVYENGRPVRVRVQLPIKLIEQS